MMITTDHLNRNAVEAEYAVRGPIVQRAQELEEQGRRIIYCNIGNPQALKQKPLTYLRQVLSLLEYPEVLNHPETRALFPPDIVARVREILRRHPHGTGAYSQSPGIPFIRQAVADFITRRDAIPADREHIILTDGASKGVQAVITALLRGANDGFLIPIPQYPLYSASLTLFGGKKIGYHLDESRQWELNAATLAESYDAAVRDGIHPVAMVVINPGNPTGAVLSAENIRMVIGFARRHGLAIIADEVYQENVYHPGLRFVSFARTMVEMGEKDVTLFSLHSVSKGFLGECGHRGGYVEFRNIPDDVMAEFVKLQSISLCANVVGQFATYLMVDPPHPGDESYSLYVRERDAILDDLKVKASILGEGLNAIEGMSVRVPHGAMYAFVRFELPGGEEARSMPPAERERFEAKRDSDYCLALLEETGICVVPGSGFGQMPGTLHFRTTFLPPRDEIETLVKKMKTFHERYIRELAEA
jgi:aspartate/methionine/tyrosine aminotransferase